LRSPSEDLQTGQVVVAKPNDPVLDRLVGQIVERIDPVAVHLFGSRASGEADEDSDYDLFVVVDDDVPEGHANLSTARSLINDTGVPVDIVLVRKGTFARRSEQVGTLSHEVRHHGIMIHERSRRPRAA
jgi:uncharacterized protein